MLTYNIIHPDEDFPNLDVTNYVQRGISNFTELAFDLDRVTTPSAGDLVLDNTEADFEQGVGYWQEEITSYIVTIKENNIDIFVALIDDIEFKENTATFKLRGVVNDLIQANIPQDNTNYSRTGTPSEIIQDILTNQVNLVNLFIDAVAFNNMASSEAARGIIVKLDIPAGDAVPLSDILQNMYTAAGLYVYSNNGILRPARLGTFGLNSFDYFLDEAVVIAGSAKRRRPLKWQKTRVVLPTLAGPFTRTIDADFAEGASILAKFREKTLESDGLGGKLNHFSTDSAIEASKDLLGWRGFPRHELKIDADLLAESNEALIKSIPLFAKIKIDYLTGSFIGILIEKQIRAGKANLTLLATQDPATCHPALITWPVAYNQAGKVIIDDSFTHKIEYFIDGDAPQTVTVSPASGPLVIDNPSQKVFYFRVIESSTCASPSTWARLDHSVEVGCFKVSINKIGQAICI